MQKRSPLKKGIILGIIILFVGASVIPLTGSTSVEKTCLDPTPDLHCDGYIAWYNVEPGETYTGEFNVENIGDPGSLLDWEIESYPEWGVWYFTPWIGTDLKPEDDPTTVQVEFICPEWPDDTTHVRYIILWEITLVNSNNPNDYEIFQIEIWNNYYTYLDHTTGNQNTMSTVSSNSNKNMEQSSMPTFTDPTIVSILPSTQIVEQGEPFQVSIYIEPGEPITGINFDYLYWDPDIIHGTYGTTTGYIYNPFPIWFWFDNVNGELRDVYEIWYGPGSVSTPGTWVEMIFEAQQELGTSYLDLEGVIISDIYGSAVPLIVNDGSVTIVEPDTTPPEITNVVLTTSDPLDTEPGFGWENFSCTVIDDDSGVNEVELVLYDGENEFFYFMMINDGDNYCCNITITDAAEYIYYINAVDQSGNSDFSGLLQFDLPLNEDVNMDGAVAFMDLVAISLRYGDHGPPGWIREDVNNDGVVNLLDLCQMSIHYYEEW